jgi:Filamin/ABP280 repeat
MLRCSCYVTQFYVPETLPMVGFSGYFNSMVSTPFVRTLSSTLVYEGQTVELRGFVFPRSFLSVCPLTPDEIDPVHEVGDSPMTIEFGDENQSPNTTFAAGPGVITATIGVPTSFVIYCHDANGAPLTDGNAKVSMFAMYLDTFDSPFKNLMSYNVTYRGDGNYGVTYVIHDTLPGRHLLNVLTTGKQLAGSPYPLGVYGPSPVGLWNPHDTTIVGMVNALTEIPRVFSVIRPA